ncbi:hypothetical protein BESB_029230 [Besnoitia besnoiti]|uniref:Protein kinase domain-containing protein n=1 Tax=Besnoitia besnoiti TaxID=94643 RepID=A0A2A9LYH2_BESBE|nr:uncharacterized protein BESB_029230 [Besnoitia besnoiti]PFH31488.1 hypothetical protein BESB_029230 [Besnoitia besnoiti]
MSAPTGAAHGAAAAPPDAEPVSADRETGAALPFASARCVSRSCSLPVDVVGGGDGRPVAREEDGDTRQFAVLSAPVVSHEQEHAGGGGQSQSPGQYAHFKKKSVSFDMAGVARAAQVEEDHDRGGSAVLPGAWRPSHVFSATSFQGVNAALSPEKPRARASPARENPADRCSVLQRRTPEGSQSFSRVLGSAGVAGAKWRLAGEGDSADATTVAPVPAVVASPQPAGAPIHAEAPAAVAPLSLHGGGSFYGQGEVAFELSRQRLPTGSPSRESRALAQFQSAWSSLPVLLPEGRTRGGLENQGPGCKLEEDQSVESCDAEAGAAAAALQSSVVRGQGTSEEEGRCAFGYAEEGSRRILEPPGSGIFRGQRAEIGDLLAAASTYAPSSYTVTAPTPPSSPYHADHRVQSPKTPVYGMHHNQVQRVLAPLASLFGSIRSRTGSLDDVLSAAAPLTQSAERGAAGVGRAADGFVSPVGVASVSTAGGEACSVQQLQDSLLVRGPGYLPAAPSPVPYLGFYLRDSSLHNSPRAHLQQPRSRPPGFEGTDLRSPAYPSPHVGPLPAPRATSAVSLAGSLVAPSRAPTSPSLNLSTSLQSCPSELFRNSLSLAGMLPHSSASLSALPVEWWDMMSGAFRGCSPAYSGAPFPAQGVPQKNNAVLVRCAETLLLHQREQLRQLQIRLQEQLEKQAKVGEKSEEAAAGKSERAPERVVLPTQLLSPSLFASQPFSGSPPASRETSAVSPGCCGAPLRMNEASQLRAASLWPQPVAAGAGRNEGEGDGHASWLRVGKSPPCASASELSGQRTAQATTSPSSEGPAEPPLRSRPASVGRRAEGVKESGHIEFPHAPCGGFVLQPGRILTTDSVGVYNGGFDNRDHDYMAKQFEYILPDHLFLQPPPLHHCLCARGNDKEDRGEEERTRSEGEALAGAVGAPRDKGDRGLATGNAGGVKTRGQESGRCLLAAADRRTCSASRRGAQAAGSESKGKSGGEGLLLSSCISSSERRLRCRRCRGWVSLSTGGSNDSSRERCRGDGQQTSVGEDGVVSECVEDVSFLDTCYYQVHELLGRGTFGHVYECLQYDGLTGKPVSVVAVKIVKNEEAYMRNALQEVFLLRLLFRNLTETHVTNGIQARGSEGTSRGEPRKDAGGYRGGVREAGGVGREEGERRIQEEDRSSKAERPVSSVDTSPEGQRKPGGEQASSRGREECRLIRRRVGHLLHQFTYRRHVCLVFELLHTDLYQLLKKGRFRGLPLVIVQQIAVQLIQAVSQLQQARIAHCDLKPENVLIYSATVTEKVRRSGSRPQRAVQQALPTKKAPSQSYAKAAGGVASPQRSSDCALSADSAPSREEATVAPAGALEGLKIAAEEASAVSAEGEAILEKHVAASRAQNSVRGHQQSAQEEECVEAAQQKRTQERGSTGECSELGVGPCPNAGVARTPAGTASPMPAGRSEEGLCGDGSWRRSGSSAPLSPVRYSAFCTRDDAGCRGDMEAGRRRTLSAGCWRTLHAAISSKCHRAESGGVCPLLLAGVQRICPAGGGGTQMLRRKPRDALLLSGGNSDERGSEAGKEQKCGIGRIHSEGDSSSTARVGDDMVPFALSAQEIDRLFDSVAGAAVSGSAPHSALASTSLPRSDGKEETSAVRGARAGAPVLPPAAEIRLLGEGRSLVNEDSDGRGERPAGKSSAPATSVSSEGGQAVLQGNEAGCGASATVPRKDPSASGEAAGAKGATAGPRKDILPSLSVSPADGTRDRHNQQQRRASRCALSSATGQETGVSNEEGAKKRHGRPAASGEKNDQGSSAGAQELRLFIKVVDFSSSCILPKTLPKPAVSDIVSLARMADNCQSPAVSIYPQSRFYGAPEAFLGVPYWEKIDLWAVGCILAELFLGQTLLPGASDYDQIRRLVELFGLPPGWMLDAGARVRSYFVKEEAEGQVGGARARAVAREEGDDAFVSTEPSDCGAAVAPSGDAANSFATGHVTSASASGVTRGGSKADRAQGESAGRRLAAQRPLWRIKTVSEYEASTGSVEPVPRKHADIRCLADLLCLRPLIVPQRVSREAHRGHARTSSQTKAGEAPSSLPPRRRSAKSKPSSRSRDARSSSPQAPRQPLSASATLAQASQAHGGREERETTSEQMERGSARAAAAPESGDVGTEPRQPGWSRDQDQANEGDEVGKASGEGRHAKAKTGSEGEPLRRRSPHSGCCLTCSTGDSSSSLCSSCFAPLSPSGSQRKQASGDVSPSHLCASVSDASKANEVKGVARPSSVFAAVTGESAVQFALRASREPCSRLSSHPRQTQEREGGEPQGGPPAGRMSRPLTMRSDRSSCFLSPSPCRLPELACTRQQTQLHDATTEEGEEAVGDVARREAQSRQGSANADKQQRHKESRERQADAVGEREALPREGCAAESSSRRDSSVERQERLRRLFIDFLGGLLQVDPLQRLSAEEALRHPFIASAAACFSGDEPSTSAASAGEDRQQPATESADAQADRQYRRWQSIHLKNVLTLLDTERANQQKRQEKQSQKIREDAMGIVPYTEKEVSSGFPVWKAVVRAQASFLLGVLGEKDCERRDKKATGSAAAAFLTADQPRSVPGVSSNTTVHVDAMAPSAGGKRSFAGSGHAGSKETGVAHSARDGRQGSDTQVSDRGAQLANASDCHRPFPPPGLLPPPGLAGADEAGGGGDRGTSRVHAPQGKALSASSLSEAGAAGASILSMCSCDLEGQKAKSGEGQALPGEIERSRQKPGVQGRRAEPQRAVRSPARQSVYNAAKQASAFGNSLGSADVPGSSHAVPTEYGEGKERRNDSTHASSWATCAESQPSSSASSSSTAFPLSSAQPSSSSFCNVEAAASGDSLQALAVDLSRSQKDKETGALLKRLLQLHERRIVLQRQILERRRKEEEEQRALWIQQQALLLQLSRGREEDIRPLLRQLSLDQPLQQTHAILDPSSLAGAVASSHLLSQGRLLGKAEDMGQQLQGDIDLLGNAGRQTRVENQENPLSLFAAAAQPMSSNLLQVQTPGLAGLPTGPAAVVPPGFQQEGKPLRRRTRAWTFACSALSVSRETRLAGVSSLSFAGASPLPDCGQVSGRGGAVETEGAAPGSLPFQSPSARQAPVSCGDGEGVRNAAEVAAVSPPATHPSANASREQGSGAPQAPAAASSSPACGSPVPVPHAACVGGESVPSHLLSALGEFANASMRLSEGPATSPVADKRGILKSPGARFSLTDAATFGNLSPLPRNASFPSVPLMREDAGGADTCRSQTSYSAIFVHGGEAQVGKDLAARREVESVLEGQGPLKAAVCSSREAREGLHTADAQHSAWARVRTPFVNAVAASKDEPRAFPHGQVALAPPWAAASEVVTGQKRDERAVNEEIAQLARQKAAAPLPSPPAVRGGAGASPLTALAAAAGVPVGSPSWRMASPCAAASRSDAQRRSDPSSLVSEAPSFPLQEANGRHAMHGTPPCISVLPPGSYSSLPSHGGACAQDAVRHDPLVGGSPPAAPLPCEREEERVSTPCLAGSSPAGLGGLAPFDGERRLDGREDLSGYESWAAFNTPYSPLSPAVSSHALRRTPAPLDASSDYSWGQSQGYDGSSSALGLLHSLWRLPVSPFYSLLRPTGSVVPSVAGSRCCSPVSERELTSSPGFRPESRASFSVGGSRRISQDLRGVARSLRWGGYLGAAEDLEASEARSGRQSVLRGGGEFDGRVSSGGMSRPACVSALPHWSATASYPRYGSSCLVYGDRKSSTPSGGGRGRRRQRLTRRRTDDASGETEWGGSSRGPFGRDRRDEGQGMRFPPFAEDFSHVREVLQGAPDLFAARSSAPRGTPTSAPSSYSSSGDVCSSLSGDAGSPYFVPSRASSSANSWSSASHLQRQAFACARDK